MGRGKPSKRYRRSRWEKRIVMSSLKSPQKFGKETMSTTQDLASLVKSQKPIKLVSTTPYYVCINGNFVFMPQLGNSMQTMRTYVSEVLFQMLEEILKWFARLFLVLLIGFFLMVTTKLHFTQKIQITKCNDSQCTPVSYASEQVQHQNIFYSNII